MRVDGRNRSFLHNLGPIRREVARQVEPTVRSAREAAETHRKALAARDKLIADLRNDNDELRHRVAAAEAETRELRAELAQHQAELQQREEHEAEQRRLLEQQAEQRRREEREAEQQRLREQQAERRQRDQREAEDRRRREAAAISSDLFRCLDCSSLWLLTAWPDGIRTVHRPVGPGCPTCADQPLRRLPAVKASLVDAADEVPRPATEAPDLLEHDPNAAVARAVAREAGDIDRIHKAVNNRIAWCATEILGQPDVR